MEGSNSLHRNGRRAANKGEYENSYQVNVPAHGVVVLKIEASDYGKKTFEPEMVGSFSGASISAARNNFSSGIGSVGYLGMGNEVVLDVCVALAGTYSLKIKAIPIMFQAKKLLPKRILFYSKNIVLRL